MFIGIITIFSLFTVVYSTPTKREDSALVYTQCNRPNVFALTFDDGPFDYSWDLAYALHERGIRATFFTNGHNYYDQEPSQVQIATTLNGTKSYNDILKYYFDLGHEIGSHTYRHTDLPGLTEQQVLDEMNLQSDLIYSAVGVRPALMRPPRGEIDSNSGRVLGYLGYSVINWDLDTKDWEQKGFESQQHMVRALVENDIPNETPGHICLQHDVYQQSTKELTPWLIDYITGKNYTFVTVSDCLGIKPYLE